MLLLDTCALLWLAGDQDKLSSRAKAALARSHDALHVSAISALEIAIKVSKGKLELPSEPATWYPNVLARYGIREVPVTGAIALRAPIVAMSHADPADRIVVSTALVVGLHVVTSDTRIRACGEVMAIW